MLACASLVLAVDIFTSGVSYKYYRIPSIVRLSDGRMTLFAEGRNVGADVGWVDIVFRTSLDTTGDRWGPMHVLHSESTNTSWVSINNPAPIVLDDCVVILFARNVKQLLMLRSLDPHGQEWPTTPVDITSALRLSSPPTLAVPGPPGGLRLPSGRLIVSAYWVPHAHSSTAGRADEHSSSPGHLDAHSNAVATSGALFSDDNGRTWASSNNTIVHAHGSLSVPAWCPRLHWLQVRSASAQRPLMALLLCVCVLQVHGGEGQIAVAPNGSLIFDIRAGGALRHSARPRTY
jgi:hypothetical protein